MIIIAPKAVFNDISAGNERMKCCKKSIMVKVNRKWFEKLIYSSIYKCNNCNKSIKLKAS